MRGMHDIQEIVFLRVSRNGGEYLQDGPKQKRQRPDAQSPSSSRYLDGRPRYTAEFRVYWKVKEFMKEQFGGL